jgi:hypothetical protein
MFNIIKNIKIVLAIIKWLQLFCRYNSWEVLYGDHIYNLYVDAVVVSTQYVRTKTALTYLCNLANTDYELPEDDTVVSKHVGAA